MAFRKIQLRRRRLTRKDWVLARERDCLVVLREALAAVEVDFVVLQASRSAPVRWRTVRKSTREAVAPAREVLPMSLRSIG